MFEYFYCHKVHSKNSIYLTQKLPKVTSICSQFLTNNDH